MKVYSGVPQVSCEWLAHGARCHLLQIGAEDQRLASRRNYSALTRPKAALLSTETVLRWSKKYL